MARHDWAAEDVWGIFILFDDDGKEGDPRIFIPVAWYSLQYIKGFYEMEVSVWGGNGKIFEGV